MKKLIAIAAAAAITAMAGTAAASDTNTLTVTASVTGTCKFSVPKTSSLSFGALDPSSSTAATASTTTTFWCTKGVTTDAITENHGIHASGTTNRMQHATITTEFIPYSLTLTKDSSTNQGPASPRTLTIAGTIANADYVNASSGSYADTVTLTINP